MGADAPPPGSKGIGDRVFGDYGVATVVMQILLMLVWFDVDGNAELTLLDVNIHIQEGDMGLGGVPLQSIKILSMTPFGREVKPWVPCRRFMAHKRTSSRN